MFSLSTKSDYGLLLLSLLVGKKSQKNNYVSISSIAKENNLPYAFISRIASELSTAGILESREGILGGYKLAKDPSKISVASVIEVLEGSISPLKCTSESEKCEYVKICPICGTWQKGLKNKMQRVLNSYTLKDLVEKR